VPDIVVENVSRRFRTWDRGRGLAGAVRDLFRVSSTERTAVADLDFVIRQGEAVALIGPNGAGKSTTVKMLAGILKPSEGRIRVGTLDPWVDRTRHVRGIGAVFGQRTQLWWDLAVVEAMDLCAAMFGVPDDVYRRRVAHFDEVLGIGPLLHTPVRQLSLGERMRCELAAALLHEPPILFLDEPTIGLDVAVKLRLRAFLAEVRDAGRTTILLTTHDLDDVTALCPRTLLLSEGKLLHDGPLADLAARLGGRRSLHLTLRVPPTPESFAGLPPVEVRSPTELRIAIEGDTQAPDLVRAVLARFDVVDLRLEDPSVDELIARFYERGA
jgi:ABC-2 type transport system ATP-binding protein